jgi:hypothetical protein
MENKVMPEDDEALAELDTAFDSSYTDMAEYVCLKHYDQQVQNVAQTLVLVFDHSASLANSRIASNLQR